jgi:hypothetical protein
LIVLVVGQQIVTKLLTFKTVVLSDNWHLVFSDEFNGDSIDTNKWNVSALYPAYCFLLTYFLKITCYLILILITLFLLSHLVKKSSGELWERRAPVVLSFTNFSRKRQLGDYC